MHADLCMMCARCRWLSVQDGLYIYQGRARYIFEKRSEFIVYIICGLLPRLSFGGGVRGRRCEHELSFSWLTNTDWTNLLTRAHGSHFSLVYIPYIFVYTYKYICIHIYIYIPVSAMDFSIPQQSMLLLTILEMYVGYFAFSCVWDITHIRNAWRRHVCGVLWRGLRSINGILKRRINQMISVFLSGGAHYLLARVAVCCTTGLITCSRSRVVSFERAHTQIVLSNTCEINCWIFLKGYAQQSTVCSSLSLTQRKGQFVGSWNRFRRRIGPNQEKSDIFKPSRFGPLHQPHIGFWLFAWSRCGRIVKKSNRKDSWYQDYSVSLTSPSPSCHQMPSPFVTKTAQNIWTQAVSILVERTIN